MEIKRKKKIDTIFITYLAVFLGQCALLAAAAYIALNIMINTGFLQPAVYTLNQLEAASGAIRESRNVGKDIIPDGAGYGVYDAEGNYLYGSYGKEEQKKAWKYKESGNTQPGLKTFYRFIEREGGETCIIRYDILAQFADPSLRERLPNAEWLFCAVILAVFLLQTAWTARSFGSYLSRRLKTLNEATDRIKESNLEFGREYSDIREIDDVLESLFRMKEALKESLEEQWKSEEMKKEQVAALAHDIKTPLTVIRGNAELIHETSCDPDVKEYNRYVTDSVKEIEEYLLILQETLRSEGGRQEEKKRLCTEAFIGQLSEKAESLGIGKKIKVETHIDAAGTDLWVQEAKLYRAFMNILANAVEYTPDSGSIFIDTRVKRTGSERWLETVVTDNGPGFTKEELKAASDQFFQGDRSRHRRGHYGMGLYIADSFIRQQGGTMEADNSPETGGARIKVRIPLYIG
ncbi:sensor histidine kinase [Dorea sp. D27]|uniref:sensor histidine kinase n=1 Tax=Dorea sp. D27 TaxID=658665 RepID=UPI000673660A|nr:HAMP domain-containing sensor histidine kinase [Dorea sp. D27]KMZ55847.1 putative subtilin biosynthesis sensor protein SpaK [Dorea sp. D27]